MTRHPDCQAKNPDTCPKHGHKAKASAMEQRISELLNSQFEERSKARDEERLKIVKEIRKQSRREALKEMFLPAASTISVSEWWAPADRLIDLGREEIEDATATREAVRTAEASVAAAEQECAASENFLETEKYRNVKKMPALFVIDRTIHKATDAVNEKGAWVFEEPSTVTIKRDGTGITVTEDGKVYARRTVKKGRPVPPGFLLAELDTFTGHQFGLEPIEQSGFHKIFKEAAEGFDGNIPAGTYELLGPKLAGNPENLDKHLLAPHGTEEATEIPDMRNIPREQAYEILKPIFAGYKERGIEGVVWWGADGKRTKLRVYDYWGDPNRR